MNVLMNGLSAVSGGAASYLRNLVPLLSGQFQTPPYEHKLKILVHDSQRKQLGDLPGVQWVMVGGSQLTGWRRVLWERRNIERIARETDADVIFTPYQIGRRVENCRQVLMIRNMEVFHYKPYTYSLKSRFRNSLLYRQSAHDLRLADRVIAVSEFAEDQLLKGLGISAKRIRRIYHGRDVAFSPDGDPKEDLSRLEKLGIEDDFLLTSGSLLPYRRCEDVIAAFNRFAGSQINSLRLVIAGTGSDARYGKMIRRVIAESPYRDRILSVGHVSKADMGSLYRRSSACILASEIEACPNIAIEAMASGCAVISSDCPPLPEIFAGSSLMFGARNVEDLERKIQVCLRDENTRSDMSGRALRRAQDFSWEQCAEETYAALVEWPEG